MNTDFLHPAAPPTVFTVFPTPPFILKSFALSVPLDYEENILTCLAFGVPLLTSVDWYKITNHGNRERHLSTVNTHRSGYSSADLVFPDGFQFSDAGSYVCTATSNERTSAQSSGVTLMLITSPMFLPVTPVPCFAGTDTVNFQIHILNASCNEWDASLIQQVMFEIQQSLVGVVTARCDECIQGSDAIMLNMEPMCNAQRTIIRGVISRETEDVFCTLNSWHQSGSAVRFRNTLHLIDRTCNFKVESLSSTICSGVTTEEVIIEPQASSAAAGSAAAVGALLVVATAVIISVAAAVFVHRRYTKTFVVVFHV